MTTGEWEIVPCAACGRPVVWAYDRQMAKIAVDVEASAQGTLSLSLRWDGQLQVRVPSAHLAFGLQTLRTPHMKTCPKVGQLKKARSS